MSWLGFLHLTTCGLALHVGTLHDSCAVAANYLEQFAVGFLTLLCSFMFCILLSCEVWASTSPPSPGQELLEISSSALKRLPKDVPGDVDVLHRFYTDNCFNAPKLVDPAPPRKLIHAPHTGQIPASRCGMKLPGNVRGIFQPQWLAGGLVPPLNREGLLSSLCSPCGSVAADPCARRNTITFNDNS